MILYKDLLKKNNIRAYRYEKKKKSIIIDSNQGRYILKRKNNNSTILNYLNNRNFNYYPSIIDQNNDYSLYKYIPDNSIPNEQKIIDLIFFVALLHSKTTYYKKIDESNYKELYEDISNNILYLKEYYMDLITLIEEKEYFSPAESLIANNISLFFNSLDYCKKEVDNWYKSIKNHHKIRISVVHNDLKLSNFVQNDNSYLINWDKAKFDLPIYDLYKLYLNHYLEFDFIDILNKYEKEYPLKDEEWQLLAVLISIPQKLELTEDDYNNCIKIKNEIRKLNSSNLLIKKKKLKK